MDRTSVRRGAAQVRAIVFALAFAGVLAAMTPTLATAGTLAGVINVNTASAEQLTLLPGDVSARPVVFDDGGAHACAGDVRPDNASQVLAACDDLKDDALLPSAGVEIADMRLNHIALTPGGRRTEEQSNE